MDTVDGILCNTLEKGGKHSSYNFTSKEIQSNMKKTTDKMAIESEMSSGQENKSCSTQKRKKITDEKYDEVEESAERNDKVFDVKEEEGSQNKPAKKRIKSDSPEVNELKSDAYEIETYNDDGKNDFSSLSAEEQKGNDEGNDQDYSTTKLNENPSFIHAPSTPSSQVLVTTINISTIENITIPTNDTTTTNTADGESTKEENMDFVAHQEQQQQQLQNQVSTSSVVFTAVSSSSSLTSPRGIDELVSNDDDDKNDERESSEDKNQYETNKKNTTEIEKADKPSEVEKNDDSKSQKIGESNKSKIHAEPTAQKEDQSPSKRYVIFDDEDEDEDEKLLEDKRHQHYDADKAEMKNNDGHSFTEAVSINKEENKEEDETAEKVEVTTDKEEDIKSKYRERSLQHQEVGKGGQRCQRVNIKENTTRYGDNKSKKSASAAKTPQRKLRRLKHRQRCSKNQPQKQRRSNGYDIFISMTQKIQETAISREQVAISISEPTLTGLEEEKLKNGSLTEERHISSWTEKRLKSERTWIYVHPDYEGVYQRYYSMLAFADKGGMELAESMNDAQDNDNNEESASSKIVLPELKYGMKVIWDCHTSYCMQECIASLLETNEVEWKKNRQVRDEKMAFTHLVALTMVMYHIDHWHNVTENPEEELVELAKWFSDRWRYVLSYSNERLGLDEETRRGLLMFMTQIEQNWKESSANNVLGGKFQFKFRSTINGLVKK